MTPPVPDLEYSADEMQRLADLVVRRSIAHVESLRAQPVTGDVRAEALCRTLREPAPLHVPELDTQPPVRVQLTSSR